MWDEFCEIYSENEVSGNEKNLKLFIEKIKESELYHSVYQFQYNRTKSKKKAIWVLLYDSCSDEADKLYELKLDLKLEDDYEVFFCDAKVELEVLRHILYYSGVML